MFEKVIDTLAHRLGGHCQPYIANLTLPTLHPMKLPAAHEKESPWIYYACDNSTIVLNILGPKRIK
jgi:hypothetical protein